MSPVYLWVTVAGPSASYMSIKREFKYMCVGESLSIASVAYVKVTVGPCMVMGV